MVKDRGDGPLLITVVGDLLDQGVSENIGLLIGDLGFRADSGAGEEFAILFGDSWRGPGFGEGEWMSPRQFSSFRVLPSLSESRLLLGGRGEPPTWGFTGAVVTAELMVEEVTGSPSSVHAPAG